MTLAFPGLLLVLVGLLVAQASQNAGFIVVVVGAVLILAGVFA